MRFVTFGSSVMISGLWRAALEVDLVPELLQVGQRPDDRLKQRKHVKLR